MNNPTIPDERPIDGAVVTPKSGPRHHVEGLDRSMRIERVGSACRTLEILSTCLGWGLPVLGLLSGIEGLLEMRMIGIYRANWGDWTGSVLRLTYRLMAYCLAGLGTFAFLRLLASVVRAYFEHLSLVSQNSAVQTDRGVMAIERLAKAVESWNGAMTPASVANDVRARSLAEIEEAIRASRWDQAVTLLDDSDAVFPDEPALVRLRQELSNAIQKANRDQLAQLEVARQVNDFDRVLEIYHALIPTLESDARISLDRELAKWFMTAIHRRLRTGTIQIDVVQLVSRIADVFSTTVEGASLRASLPTLRRSVGLCPRCSRPYAGLADACPECLTAGTSEP
jgi:hypothetical protein